MNEEPLPKAAYHLKWERQDVYTAEQMKSFRAENCDTKRLDWVIAQGEEFRCFNDLDAYQVSGRGVVIGHGKTAREAIDAARKAAE